MKSPISFLRFTTIFFTFLLVACGGGGGSSPSAATPSVQTPPSPAPVPEPTPTVVKRAAITGFGSVFVGGERFETDENTRFRQDDDLIGESDLEIGMVVRVRSRSRNSAGEWIAEHVEFDEDVKGPIDEISGDVITVLGQVVQVTSDTRFDDGLTLSDLAQGDLLEVSGYRVADDALDALFIERKTALDEYEVLGQVRDLDTTAMTFRVGGLLVDYGLGPALLDDLDGGLANGLLVAAEDANNSYLPGDLRLVATKVEGEDRFEFKDEDDNDEDEHEDEGETEVEGVISEIVNASSFRLGDVLVLHDAGTVFFFGDASDLAVGTRVEAEGRLVNGAVATQLDAAKIKFKNNAARVAGLVNAVDEEGGTVTVLDVVVEIGGATELEDDLDDVDPLLLSDIEPGEFLEVRGAQFENTIRATRVEREDADQDSELRGTVEGFDPAARTVTLLGQLIVTDGGTEYEWDDDESLTADEFFARLHVDQTNVKAKWDRAVADTLLPVKELSVED